MNDATVVFRKIAKYGAMLAIVIGGVGSIAGWFAAEMSGVLSALVGTAMAAVFLGITSLSIVLAARASKFDMFSPAFFGVVLGGWLLKFVIFLALVFLLREQSWVEPMVLFLSIVAAVIGSLIVDIAVIATSRIPYVSERSSRSGAGQN